MQVKSPKVYVRDSGLLHLLLGISDANALVNHPRLGAFWEGFVGLLGVECKRADAPRITPSIRIALQDLGLERIAVLYPGSKRFSIAEQVTAVPLAELADGLAIFD